jgi:hypothetical protein
MLGIRAFAVFSLAIALTNAPVKAASPATATIVPLPNVTDLIATSDLVSFRSNEARYLNYWKEWIARQ